MRIDVTQLTDWDSALWTRSKVNGGTKTAGALARTTLQLAERFTGNAFFWNSSVVRAQAFPKNATRETSEAPKSAIPPTWDHIESLESAITTGATAQQRVLSGYFIFLVHSSHRCANGQRSRRLTLTPDALLGESLLKGKPTWTKWAAARLGITRDDWAEPWMAELRENGMPGPDYLIRAPNASLDRWLDRPARYADFSRALHLLLMVYGGETPSTVVDYTPHGCRHVQVTAAAQLVSQGLLTDAAVEVLGHWGKGSKMPRTYNDAACVTELATRSIVLDSFRSGWRPAANGSLPAPATPAMVRNTIPGTPLTTIATQRAERSSDTGAKVNDRVNPTTHTKVLTVVNTRRKMAHRVRPPSVTTTCGFYTCGSALNPTQNAVFGPVGKAVMCTACFGRT